MDAWIRWYPMDIMPGLWDKIEEAVQDETLISPDEVLREIERKDDTLHKWAKSQKMFYPLDEEVQQRASSILAQFPKIVKAGSTRNQGDVFVIALAMNTNSEVVTGEGPGSLNDPKIPFVCSQLNINCIKMPDLIRAKGWVFR